MRKFSIEADLKKTFKNIYIKDIALYNTLMNKINEILICDKINHYKNLRKPLQFLKRVHIRGPFVLTFKYIKEKDKVIFYDLDHHDRIYY